MRIVLKVLFGLLIFSSTLSSGQSKIKVTETRSKVVKLKGEFFALNSMSDGSLLFLTKKHKFWITSFNAKIYGPLGGAGRMTFLSKLSPDLKEKVEKQLPISYLNKRINYKDIKKIGNKYVLFFTFINVKLKKEYLFHVQIDPSDLSWYGKPNFVASIPYKAKNGSIRGYFTMDLSDNGKYIIVSAYNPLTVQKIWFNHRGLKSYDKGKLPKSFSFYIIDDNLNIVNQRKNFRIESKKGNSLTMRNFKCDDNGNVYVIAQNYKRIKSNSKRQTMDGTLSRTTDLKIENMNFTILKLGIDNENYEYETDKDIFLVDLNIGFSPDNKFVDLVGIIHEEISGVEVSTGVYSIKLLMDDFSEESNEIVLFQSELITKINAVLLEKSNKLLSRQRSKKKIAAVKQQVKFYENGITNLKHVSKVVYNKNNEVSVILEKQWLETITVSTTDGNGNKSSKTYYIWHYGELITISGLNDKNTDPVMDFIFKNEYSLTKYISGIDVKTDQNNWFVFGKNELFKIDNENLEYTSYKIETKGKNGGGKMFKPYNQYRNSIFSRTFILGNREFVGFQYQTPRKLIIAYLKVS